MIKCETVLAKESTVYQNSLDTGTAGIHTYLHRADKILWFNIRYKMTVTFSMTTRTAKYHVTLIENGILCLKSQKNS